MSLAVISAIQLTLTKSLLDNGWILNDPFMGAPDVAKPGQISR